MALDTVPSAPDARGGSPFAPLARPLFRSLWIASVVSNVGSWIQSVAAGWLMIDLDPSPLMVGMVQTASALPFFLLALPVGALGDIVDRRRFLLVAQSWSLLASAALAGATAFGWMTPWMLLGFTLALGVGAAMTAPIWQAIIPEVVPRPDLLAAIALGSVGFNLARTVGPALGGVVVAAAGPAAAFLLNALSFLAVLVAVFAWRRDAPAHVLPPERFSSAVQAGVRYARHSLPLRVVLVRAGAFIVFASAPWVLLPLFAKARLGARPSGYGLLLAALGVGALAGALVLPRIRRRVTPNALAGGASLAFGLVTAALAAARGPRVSTALLVFGGAAWMVLMSTLNVAAQAAVAGWVRARALSLMLLVMQGGMALGGLLWGWAAGRFTLETTLAAAGVLTALNVLLARTHPLPRQDVDMAQWIHWPEPPLAERPSEHSGPVLVTVEYVIEPGRAPEFAAAMADVRRLRRRDGATDWGLYRDAADPSRVVEVFVVDSWTEHLRQHERSTLADREIEGRARAFHVAVQPPVVRHLIWAGDP